jgi:HNH endonuclease
MSKGRHQDGRWYKRSDRQLRANPLCLCCFAICRTTAAELSDHIVPVSNGGDLLRGELQSACRRCHDTVKRELERLFKLGKCKAADLRLDSELAKQLARRRYRRFGVDGRVIDPNDESNIERVYSLDLEGKPLASPSSGSAEEP